MGGVYKLIISQSLAGQRQNKSGATLCGLFHSTFQAVQSKKRDWEELHNELTKNETDKESFPDLATQNLQTQDDLVNFDHGLFEAIELITECDSSLHQVKSTMFAEEPNKQTSLNTARMCLHAPRPSQQAISRSINMLILARDMRFWPEFYLMYACSDKL